MALEGKITQNNSNKMYKITNAMFKPFIKDKA